VDARSACAGGDDDGEQCERGGGRRLFLRGVYSPFVEVGEAWSPGWASREGPSSPCNYRAPVCRRCVSIPTKIRERALESGTQNARYSPFSEVSL